MKQLLFISTVLLLTLSSCRKTGGTTNQPSSTAPIGKDIDIVSVMTAKGGELGSTYDYVTDIDVAQAIGKSREEIVFSDPYRQKPDPKSSAGFYKWEDFDVRGAGIFLQIFKNPTDEASEYYIPDYIARFVDQKIASGEKDAAGNVSEFRRLDWGDAGCYDVESAKYYWSLGNEVAFQIAFNTSHSDEEQLQIASVIAEKLTRKFSEI